MLDSPKRLGQLQNAPKLNKCGSTGRAWPVEQQSGDRKQVDTDGSPPQFQHCWPRSPPPPPGEGAYIAQQTLAQAVGQQLDQPGMGWLGQIQSDPKLKDVQINWQGVPVEQKQWAEAQSGLTQTGAAVVAIVAVVLSWGAASAAGGAVATSAGEGVAMSGGGYYVSASTGMVISSTVAAGVSSVAAQAAVSLVNHNGNIGAVLEDLASSRGIKTTLAAMVTAGTGQYFVNNYGAAGLGVKILGGCASGAISGSGCEQGATFSGVTGSAGWTYNSWVGYDANAAPGTNSDKPFYPPDDTTGQQPWYSIGRNVVGNNEPGHFARKGPLAA
jgi:Possible hemagglutinin (DUF637)